MTEPVSVLTSRVVSRALLRSARAHGTYPQQRREYRNGETLFIDDTPWLRHHSGKGCMRLFVWVAAENAIYQTYNNYCTKGQGAVKRVYHI